MKASQKELARDLYGDDSDDVPDDVDVRKPVKVTLTDDDQLFVRPLPERTRSAGVMWLYSNQPWEYHETHPENFRNHTVTITWPGANGSQKVTTLPFSLDDHTRRWEELKKEGWDFRKSPLTSRPRAQAMLDGGAYTANYNARGGQVNRNKDRLKEISQQQDAHLKNPDQVASPNVPDERYPDRDRKKSFWELVKDDCVYAFGGVKKWMNRWPGMAKLVSSDSFMSYMDNQMEDAVSNAQMHVMNRFSGEPDFVKEAFRLNKAFAYMVDFVKAKLIPDFLALQQANPASGNTFDRHALDDYEKWSRDGGADAEMDRMDKSGGSWQDLLNEPDPDAQRWSSPEDFIGSNPNRRRR